MDALRIRAGHIATERILDEGLDPSSIRLVLGASGGPKWLVLAALDRYLFGEWLINAPQDIDFIGSSIGAWRGAAACHPEAGRIFDRFHMGYFRYRYNKNDKPGDISRHTEDVLHQWISDEEKARIVSNDRRRLHIVTTRGKGLMNSQNSVSVGLGLVAAGVGVLARRDAIGRYFQRAVFSHGGELPFADQWRSFDTVTIPLQADNLAKAIMASSAIPGVNLPEPEIAGAPPGVYRDGGFIDYHFDSPFRPDDGLVLYPHFYPDLVPGWFDKMRKRKTSADALSHTIILCPTDSFIASLPNGKIPDRNDFLKMDNDQRIAAWQEVMRRSEEVRDDFMRLLERPDQLKSKLEKL